MVCGACYFLAFFAVCRAFLLDLGALVILPVALYSAMILVMILRSSSVTT